MLEMYVFSVLRHGKKCYAIPNVMIDANELEGGESEWQKRKVKPTNAKNAA
jgi:hypothetical protein